MMKIVLVTTVPVAGGVWTNVVALSGALTERGHDVLVGLDPHAAEVVADADAHAVQWAPVEAATRIPADVVHFHVHKTMDYLLMWHQARCWLRHRGRIVLTEHLPRVPASDATLPWDPSLLQGRRKPGASLAKFAAKRAQYALSNRITTVSEFGSEFMRRRYRLRSGRIDVVYNGVPPAHTAPSRRPNAEELSVVAVGELSWRKAFDVLIAAAALSETRWSLTIYGVGPRLDDLRAQATALGAPVRFAGWTPAGARIAAEHDLLCIPSRMESLPYVCLEAMTEARAIVGSRIDGIPEVVVDGVTGVLVEPDSPAALAAAIDDLNRDRARLDELGHAGAERVTDMFSLDRMVDGVESVYGSIAR